MYKPTTPLVWSRVSEGGFEAIRETLQSNGTYLRTQRGTNFGRMKEEQGVVLLSSVHGDFFTGVITDERINERAATYWEEYFDKHTTNCASFANYLTTGEFVACDPEQGNLVITQGMRPYEMASRIDIGDMVCLMYAKDRIHRSRKNDFRKRYLEVRKRRRKDKGFAGTSEFKLLQKVFTPEDILQIFQGFGCDDYHFMVCVGKRHGKPVWLAQIGYARPDEDQLFCVTTGDIDGYSGIPFISLIKKRPRERPEQQVA